MTEQEKEIHELSEELKSLMHYDEGYNEVAINHVVDKLDKLRASTITISNFGLATQSWVTEYRLV